MEYRSPRCQEDQTLRTDILSPFLPADDDTVRWIPYADHLSSSVIFPEKLRNARKGGGHLYAVKNQDRVGHPRVKPLVLTEVRESFSKAEPRRQEKGMN